MNYYLLVCAFFFLSFWTLVFVSLYEPLYKWILLAFCCHNCHNKEESFGWIRASEPRGKFRLKISVFRLGHCHLRVPGEANSQFRRQGKHSQTTHLRLVFFVLFLCFSLSISKIFTLTGWWLKETQMLHPVWNVGLVSFIFKKWNVHEVVWGRIEILADCGIENSLWLSTMLGSRASGYPGPEYRTPSAQGTNLYSWPVCE